jgi:glutathione S-transferase
MFGSQSILPYIHASRGCADHWYPADVRKRALMNDWLHHFHLGLRYATFLLREKMAHVRKQEPNLVRIKESTNMLKLALGIMEKQLADGRLYLFGAEMSIPDLLAIHELIGLELISFDFSPWPLIVLWMDRLLAIPEINKHNKVLNNAIARSKAATPKL